MMWVERPRAAVGSDARQEPMSARLFQVTMLMVRSTSSAGMLTASAPPESGSGTEDFLQVQDVGTGRKIQDTLRASEHVDRYAAVGEILNRGGQLVFAALTEGDTVAKVVDCRWKAPDIHGDPE